MPALPIYAFTFAGLLLLATSGCNKPPEHAHVESHRILVTTPVARDMVITQQYVCQIHSHRHIEVRAMQTGYLEEIPVKEGQTVKKGDSMFKVIPTLYQARLDAEIAEAKLAQLEYNYTKKLAEDKVVSPNEVLLLDAKLAKAQAKVKLSQAELNFADVKAPFDGIVDSQRHQQGSLIAEGDILTTLSDNSIMWVYFNVPEARYLDYKADPDRDNIKVELILANGKKFPHIGSIGAIEADFNNETGNIAFRADFPNPDRLLRHGQTGTIVLSRVLKDAVVIPQRATFEVLAKKYAYVVSQESGSETDRPVLTPVSDDKSHASEHAHESEHESSGEGERGVVRQREIVILNELDDIYLIKDGLKVGEMIVLEGIRQVHEGEQVKYQFLSPENALEQLKYHAE